MKVTLKIFKYRFEGQFLWTDNIIFDFLLNPLVPSVHFWTFSPCFYKKDGVPLNKIFWWNIAIIEKKADLWDFSMLKRLDEKKFLKKFFEIFWDIIFDIKAAPHPAVNTIQQKILRDILIYNVEKFKLLA